GDALGRCRSAQGLCDARGNETGSKPVDTMTVPQVVLGDQTAIATPAELMSLLVVRGKVDACLSRHFYRYTYASWEDTTADGCALEDGRKALANGGTIRDL